MPLVHSHSDLEIGLVYALIHKHIEWKILVTNSALAMLGLSGGRLKALQANRETIDSVAQKKIELGRPSEDGYDATITADDLMDLSLQS